MDGYAWAEQIRRGDVTPWRLDAAIARVEALPKLNAVVIRTMSWRATGPEHVFAGATTAREQATQRRHVGRTVSDQGSEPVHEGHGHHQWLPFLQGAVADYDQHPGGTLQGCRPQYLWQDGIAEFGQTATTESCSTVRHSTPGTANFSAGGSSGGAAAWSPLASCPWCMPVMAAAPFAFRPRPAACSASSPAVVACLQAR